MTERRAVCSRWLILCHLSIVSSFLIHVAQGFTVSRQQQQHLSCLAPPAITAPHPLRRRQPMLLLGAFPDNENKRNRQRRHIDDDDDDNSSNSLASSSYLATCIPGISSTLARELIELGCHHVQITGPSAVRFTANPSTALSTLLWARTPHKIMQLLFAQQNVNDENDVVIYNRDDLYNCIREHVNVKDLLGDGRGGLLSLSVNVIFNNQGNIPSDINHSHFTALTIKNALCDAVRDLRGGVDRPNVDLDDPDVPLVAVLRGMTSTSNTHNQDGSMSRGGGGGAQLSLYRQLHNGSLHRRGYRQEGKAIHKAAMKESLAAGLLLESEWDKICKGLKEQQENDQNQGEKKQQQQKQRLVLVDPMAGSGTLLLEGAIMAADLAPHLMRIKCGLAPGGKSQTYPPVVRWKHSDVGGGGDENEINVMEEWKRLLQDATGRAKKGLVWLKTETSLSNIELIANDWHPGALDLLESALHQAGLNEGIVKVSQLDCLDFRPFSALVSSSSSSSSSVSGSETSSDVDHDVKVMVVTNPPWGVRLGGAEDKNDNDNSNNNEEVDVEDETLHDSWEALRVFLRQACPPGKTEAWVLSGNKKSTKHLGLRRSKSIPIKVGQHDLRWIQYEIHDQQTKMAVMATKQKQQSQREEEDTQQRRPLVAHSQNEKSLATKSRRQPWKQEQQAEIVVERQKNATSTTMSPQPSSSQPKRRVVQSRQKAASDENEWLLD